MPSRSYWGITPRQSIERECARRGRAAVIAGCCDLIRGLDVDAGLVIALGGPLADRVLGTESLAYWKRVWAVRGLLWAWDDSATDAVLIALSDEQWRVRELAAKVVARHLVGAAFDAVDGLRDDSIARVRAAADRAVTVLTAAGA